MATPFGDSLRRIREGRGVSRDWVNVKARELGFPKPITKQALKGIELGWSYPQRITLVQLRAIFPELPRVA